MARETIFALASGRPPAAISVIRISGPDAHDAQRMLAGSLPGPRQAALRELRHPESRELLDHALVLRFDAPASSTGEDVLELHCHGGRAVVDAVLAALREVGGMRPAQPGEFTRRAFENGRIDLTEAEGLADLIEAETETQRRSALALAEGALSRQIATWQEQLLELSARAEAAIDYVGEDSTDIDSKLYSDCEALASVLNAWLRRPRIEPLRDGVRVVVAGPPNAGKSSLINRICGSDRAIVTNVPGTTRDHIEVPMALGGTPLLLVDTAGLRESHDPVERIGIERARAMVRGADLLIWLGEVEDAPDHPRLIRVHAQCDRPERQQRADGSLPLSSVTGEGIDTLLLRIAELAAALVPSEDALSLNRRQAMHLTEAAEAATQVAATEDPLLVAENLRSARVAFDSLTGRATVEDVLDALFGRFCLGK